MGPLHKSPRAQPDPRSVAARLQKACPLRPSLAIVLGSGFQHAAELLRADLALPYAEIPGFPNPSAGGHAGQLLIGKAGPTPVLILSGRAHYYEGHSMDQVTFPVRVLAECGVRALLLTNAAGGINPRFRPGDFMLITDHINAMGANPLRGPDAAGQPRFVDLTHTYDPQLRRLLQAAARKVALRLRSGVYLAVAGPSYETPAEIRAYARLGADAVGMSTVPEAIVARQCGLSVAGLSCITNLAAGRTARPLSHAEVLRMGKRVKSAAGALLQSFVALYGQAE